MCGRNLKNCCSERQRACGTLAPRGDAEDQAPANRGRGFCGIRWLEARCRACSRAVAAGRACAAMAAGRVRCRVLRPTTADPAPPPHRRWTGCPQAGRCPAGRSVCAVFWPGACLAFLLFGEFALAFLVAVVGCCQGNYFLKRSLTVTAWSRGFGFLLQRPGWERRLRGKRANWHGPAPALPAAALRPRTRATARRWP